MFAVKRERARVTEMIPERATGATSYRGFVSQGKEFAFCSHIYGCAHGEKCEEKETALGIRSVRGTALNLMARGGLSET